MSCFVIKPVMSGLSWRRDMDNLTRLDCSKSRERFLASLKAISTFPHTLTRLGRCEMNSLQLEVYLGVTVASVSVRSMPNWIGMLKNRRLYNSSWV